mgnify:CR=1 FL=1
MKNILYLIFIFFCFSISSCKDFEDALRRKKASTANLSCSESSTNASGTSAQDIKITSCVTENNSITFGQSYQHQLTTTGTYPGAITYSLNNQPTGMTISSSGLVQWTPSKSSEIGTHSSISVSLTTESGYILTQTYDLTVTGTCTSGNVMSIWSGDQRTSTDDNAWLGNVTAYSDNAADGDVCGQYNNEDCTAFKNYDYDTRYGSSVNLHIGPTPSATTGNMFFYNQYDDSSNVYLFWMFGVGGSSIANTVKIDVFTVNNESSDNVVESDDDSETSRNSQTSSEGLYTSSYKGRYSYGNCCSDGGVLGPFSGTSYKIFIDKGGTSAIDSNTLTLGNLDSFTYWSKDGSSFSLGDVDNFTIGYNTTLDCGD